MRKNIKSLSIEFITGLLFGIAGYLVMFYIYLSLEIVIPAVSSLSDDKTGFFIAMFIGVPLGSSLGISITKRFIFKTNKRGIPCFIGSFILALVGGRFLWPGIVNLIGVNGPTGELVTFLPLVAIFSLIGYTAVEFLLEHRRQTEKVEAV